MSGPKDDYPYRAMAPSIEDLFRKPEPEPVEPIEDISLDEPPVVRSIYPLARRDLVCPECGAAMVIRTSTKYNRPFYGCERFPDCYETHGAHRDGRPLGIPANKVTKAARVRAHRIFDQLWKSKAEAGRGLMTRPQAYAWLKRKLKLPDEDGHIGRLNMEQCDLLIKLVHSSYPEVRTVWDRLMAADPLGEDPEDAAFLETEEEESRTLTLLDVFGNEEDDDLPY